MKIICPPLPGAHGNIELVAALSLVCLTEH